MDFLRIPAARANKILVDCRNKFQMKKFSQYLCYFAKDDERYSDELLSWINKDLK